MSISRTYLFKTACQAVLLSALVACSDNDPAGVVVVTDQPVPAATGGTFTGAEGRVSVVIPAGALSEDASLTITRLASRGEINSASSSYRISLLDSSGVAVTSNQDVKITINTTVPPVHPQLGEVGMLSGNEWEGLQANFFRAGTQQVVALTGNLNGTFRAQFRTLQAITGASVDAGKEVFISETFGNEAFFGDVLELHTVLNGVAPADAVALGVQVDLTKVPQGIVDVMVGSDLAAKDTALQNPAITRALIKAGAVIGVKGVYATTDTADDTMISVGLTCALCHTNVAKTNFELTSGTTALPIGAPLNDLTPNSVIDAGAILAFTPFAVNAGSATVDLLNSWGPGRFDVRALPDNPLEDNTNNPTDNPPIWNFIDLEEQGYTIGWDGLFKSSAANNNGLASISEAVYDLVMHANGAFGTSNGTLSPELRITPPQPLLDALATAETNEPGNVITEQKLLDIQDYMRSVTSPAPGTFDATMAEAGFELFYGKANCSVCHSTPDLTGPGLFSVTATPPAGDLSAGIHVPGLRGISSTAPYFHDASAATLTDAIDQLIASTDADVPALTTTEKMQLVEYLKSL